MRQIVTCREMKALDEATIREKGIPSCVLMERAALKTVEEMEKRFQNRKKKERVLVVCGSGNNGGDGIAIARILFLRGVRSELYFVGSVERMTEETRRQWEIAENYQIPRVNNPAWSEYTTIVDAIFGVGLARPVGGHYAQVIHEMNDADAWKVAVDIPSGVDGDNGKELGIAFRADLTVTFAFRKRGMCFYPGRMYAGETIVADIGIYDTSGTPGKNGQLRRSAPLEEACKKMNPAWHLEMDDLNLLPRRVPYGNKGTFGKVLIVAGTEGMCGAAFLSASAAFAAGAGMVKIQTVEENRIPLQTLLPEAMVTCRFDEEENQKSLNWCDVLVVGPGLGVSGRSRERAEWFLSHGGEAGKPVVLDADGLNLLAVHPEWKSYIRENWILTPHLGEMARLGGKTIGEIQDSIVPTAVQCAEETKAVCVLKDACTVVADASGNTFFNLAGNPGMATAGSGDVLSGVLASVCCHYFADKQNAPDYGVQAALGVYLHSAAGDMAAEEVGIKGMTARDIIRMLPEVLKGRTL